MKRLRIVLATMLGITGVVVALAAITGASGTVSPSTFEGNDGNLVVNTAGNKDWDNAPNLAVGQDIADPKNDNSFGQGTKENDVDVSVVTGSIPNSKANLGRFGAAGEVINGQTMIYLAWTREDQSGTVNFDFELNSAPQPDLTTPGAKTLNRSVNDLLINYAFQAGSNTPTLTKLPWNGSDWGTGVPISGTCSEGATNSGTISENLGGLPAVSRPAQQFGEASINLTCAGVVAQNSCEPFSSVYVKSRSSTSFTSEIKDFVAPVTFSSSNCGTITIIKHTAPRGLDQVFNYTVSANVPGGGFSLNDAGNGGGGDSAGNTKSYTQVQPGTYTFTEGADPLGFAFATLTCTGGGANTSTSGRVATVGLDANENVVC